MHVHGTFFNLMTYLVKPAILSLLFVRSVPGSIASPFTVCAELACHITLPLLRVQGCRIYLVGTKLDVIQKQGRTARQVDYHDAVDYADSVRAVCVLETSSLTGYNVGKSSSFLKFVYMDMALVPQINTPSKQSTREAYKPDVTSC